MLHFSSTIYDFEQIYPISSQRFRFIPLSTWISIWKKSKTEDLHKGGKKTYLFHSTSLFLYALNTTSGFLNFSGVIEKDQLHEMS